MTIEKKKYIKRILICTLVAFLLLFIDQITKIVAQIYLQGAERIPLIKGWVELTYELNDSIAFGIGNGNKTFMTAIMIATPILSVAFVAIALTLFKKNMPAQVSLFVITSGAVGNFLDRLFVFENGKPVVRDFVYLRFFNVCNFADFCITLGAVALIFILLFIGPSAAFPLKKSWREEQKRQEEEKKNAAS